MLVGVHPSPARSTGYNTSDLGKSPISWFSNGTLTNKQDSASFMSSCLVLFSVATGVWRQSIVLIKCQIATVTLVVNFYYDVWAYFELYSRRYGYLASHSVTYQIIFISTSNSVAA